MEQFSALQLGAHAQTKREFEKIARGEMGAIFCNSKYLTLFFYRDWASGDKDVSITAS